MTQPKITLNRFQTKFVQASEQYPGLFGGIGNGKTFAACGKIIELATHYPNNLCLVGRLTYGELRDSTQEVFFNILDKMYPPAAWKFNKGEQAVEFWNKSTVIFRHLEAKQKILGPNLGGWYIDQAEEVDEEVFLVLQGRLRRENIPLRQGLITGNPCGHDWIYYKYGLDQGWNDYRREDDWRYKDRYRMITASTYANEDNLPKDYILQLQESYSVDWFNRYVLGSWDGFAGQIFNLAKIKEYETLPEFDMIVTAIDPAISQATSACNTAFCTLGAGVDGYIYDISTRADKWTFLETLHETEKEMYTYKPMHLGVESVAYQEALAESCRRDFPNIHVHSLKADKDKFRRAKSVSHMVDMGLVRSNSKALKDELRAFDPGMKGQQKKDRVDAFVHALHMIQKYAPVRSANPKPVVTPYQGLTSAEVHLKMTLEQQRKQFANEGQIVEEYSKAPYNPIHRDDFY